MNDLNINNQEEDEKNIEINNKYGALDQDFK